MATSWWAAHQSATPPEKRNLASCPRLCSVPAHDGAQDIAYPLDIATAQAEIDARVDEMLELVQLKGFAGYAIRTNCRRPAAAHQRWPVHSASRPVYCCSTSRWRRSTASFAPTCRSS